jgi:hypothetical protein
MLTQDALKEVINYDPTTGIFTWINKAYYRVLGKEAGSVGGKGYRYIAIQGKKHIEGRLAWLYMTGSFPPEGYEVDHIDTIKSNCKWNNLRIGTGRQNMFNQGIRSTNTSGVKGVSWCKQTKKWEANIRHEGRNIKLGRYNSIEEASTAVVAKRKQFHGEFANHGDRIAPNVGDLL